MTISYAPNFEDILLLRAFAGVEQGFYIDAGAGEPDHGSVTRAFYERGWRGIDIAPGRARHMRLRVGRPADIHLQLVPGASEADVVWFEVDAAPGSTLDETAARALAAGGADVARRPLRQQTLNAICEAHGVGVIHFLRIGPDAGAASGADALAGLDLARHRPWLLLLERAGDHARVRKHGYTLAWDDGQSVYYVADEQAALAAAFATPPNGTDAFVLHEDHPYAYPLTAWRARVAALTADVAAAEHAAQAARDWSDARVREHSERLAESTAKVAHLQAEVAARAEQAAQLQGTLHGLYASSSWRVTAPLRSLNFRLNALRARLGRLRQRLRQARSRLRPALSALVRGMVRRVVRAVMNRPAVSFFVRRQIGRHPRLTRWLRVVVQRTQAVTPASQATAPELQHLPGSARQVLSDLRRSFDSNRQP